MSFFKEVLAISLIGRGFDVDNLFLVFGQSHGIDYFPHSCDFLALGNKGKNSLTISLNRLKLLFHELSKLFVRDLIATAIVLIDDIFGFVPHEAYFLSHQLVSKYQIALTFFVDVIVYQLIETKAAFFGFVNQSEKLH